MAPRTSPGWRGGGGWAAAGARAAEAHVDPDAGIWVVGVYGSTPELPMLPQAGLDMLTRLGLHDEVVDWLLAFGKILDALRHALAHGLVGGGGAAAATVPASRFLEPAYASGDRTLYLNAYQALSEAGALAAWGGDGYDDDDDDDGDDDDGGGRSDNGDVGDSGGRLDGAGAAGIGGRGRQARASVVSIGGGGGGGGDPDGRYFSVFQELWGAVVEMEGI
ncbi:hypothetical protein HK405_009416 [Cladochytrium tenue]|nr:hypothetical protein HK405_009416 [Cladochytrium tenue]